MESSSSGGGLARRRSSGSSGRDSFSCDADPFDIPAKGAPLERLRKWRQAALVLNASRRFRYTLDLKKEEQKEEIRRKIRAQAHVIRAAFRFKEAGRIHVQSEETKVPSADGALGFGIKEEQLTALTRDHNYSGLQQYGGVSGVAHMLKTDTEKGISGDDSDLMARKNAFGSNTYPRKKGRSFLAFVWDACKDLTLIILMVAAAVSLALGITTEGIKEGWYDGASIAFAVLLVVFVTAISDYKQSLQFQNLNEEKQNIRLEVVRGGRRITVSIYDLVVGDVVPLKIGDQVPADGILVSGHSLSIDESSMTGESKIVHKDQKSPFLMSGCKVADGYGTMLVTAVGINTEWGLLMASISEDSGEETPLQVRLNGVATFIGMVGLSVALAVLVVLLARYFTGHTYNPDGSVQYVKGKMGVGQTIRGVVTIVVVAVPEGLPLAVTLTLAFSMRKMMKDKALVRRLSACETMGSATTICSDKTGTLTLNQMTVVEAYFGGKKMDSPDNAQMLSADVTSLIVEGIAQNTSGSIFEPEGGQEPEVTGSPTEKAILSWGLKLGMKFNETRSKSSILHVFPFNSEKKRGGVAVHLGGSEVHIHWKGAAEIILDSCTGWVDTDGLKHSMTPEKVAEFKKFIEDMAAASLRCVAFAYRTHEMDDVPDEDHREEWKLPEDNLIMLGIVGIKDPCRPGVRDSVRLCQAAGIKVRMVTGDNLQTARAIALECGILDDPNASEPVIIEGKTFRALSDLEREEAAEKISVMGRSSPNDKLLLVKALRARGHVVAVTGDGTNDAPALHEADIGLSMGIQGTEVAKESSDIIILDDNFASVVRVVRWGRSVYANIQKFIQFQLTVNVAALIINVVAAVSSGNVPLNAVQHLSLYVAIEVSKIFVLAVLNGFLSPFQGAIDNKYHVEKLDYHGMLHMPLYFVLLNIDLLLNTRFFVQALFQVSVLLTLNFKGISLLQLKNDDKAHADKVKNTFIFNTFVLCQVFNEFNSRKPDELNIFKGISGNHLFIGIIAITVILQALIVEFLGKFASTVKLSWQLWLVSIGLAFFSWPLAFVGKLIPVPRRPFGEFFGCCCKGSKQAPDDATSNDKEDNKPEP
uniref:Calcium-transporting ATPase n=1 Tax=Saccharum spontaneum TaxID=62335 RepID=A0A678T4G8_SACSP|nr:Calcium-transporting ATPase [Saccharum spontaneum]